MSRLFFDALSLDGRPSGTRTRIVRLVPALVDRGYDVTVAHRPELDLDARLALGGARLLEVRNAPPRNPLGRALVQRSLYAGFLSSAWPDVVSAETWPMPNCPGLIPVIHDLRYLELRQHLRLAFTMMLKRAAARATRLHVASDTVRNELVASGLVDPEKIDKVPNVTLPDLSALATPSSARRDPYVLVVGHDEQRKDFPLVHSVADAIRELGAEVVTVGRSPAEGASKGYRAGRPGHGAGARRARTGEIRSLGIVSDAELTRLYAEAKAVLAPSRYEGFGLVPLEALAAGAWVVASDIPAHREVLGDSVTYFRPGDAAEALAGLRRAVVAQPRERRERARVGRARASWFSASRAADCFERSLAKAGVTPAPSDEARPRDELGEGVI
jgi:glycosyltransferase involved in cell wall biosynthesis